MFEPITIRNKMGMEMVINNPAFLKPELIKAFMNGEDVADHPSKSGVSVDGNELQDK